MSDTTRSGRRTPSPTPLVGMLVEHPGAVAEIERIFSELPIDFCWVGVHDLSALMGFDPHAVVADGVVQPFPDELVAAIDRVRARGACARGALLGRGAGR